MIERGHPLSQRSIIIQMPVYMSSLKNAGKHIYTITLCVCVYVRKTPGAGSLGVLSTRQCCLLINKYGLSMSLIRN